LAWHDVCFVPDVLESEAGLRREHDAITDVLMAVEELVQRTRGRRSVPMLPVAGAVEFFTTYVGGCHETKEKQIVLPLLARYGAPTPDALEQIQREHEEGERLLRSLRALRSRRVRGDLAGLISEYVGLQRSHMAFEEVSVLPEMTRLLSADDDAHMRREFDRIDDEVLGPSGRDAAIALGGAVQQACRDASADALTGRRDRRVRDVMRAGRSFAAPDQSLSHAAAMMESIGARELSVVQREALVGIITRTDLELHRGHWEWTLVGAAMTHDPVTVAPDASVRIVARMLLEHGFNAMPVVEEGRVIGMIGRSDLLRLVQDEPFDAS
jgi:hemerythrin-like domain-containing protein/predicted transcriptional regulator